MILKLEKKVKQTEEHSVQAKAKGFFLGKGVNVTQTRVICEERLLKSLENAPSICDCERTQSIWGSTTYGEAVLGYIKSRRLSNAGNSHFPFSAFSFCIQISALPWMLEHDPRVGSRNKFFPSQVAFSYGVLL